MSFLLPIALRLGVEYATENMPSIREKSSQLTSYIKDKYEKEMEDYEARMRQYKLARLEREGKLDEWKIWKKYYDELEKSKEETTIKLEEIVLEEMDDDVMYSKLD
jgi:hypothetical protein